MEEAQRGREPASSLEMERGSVDSVLFESETGRTKRVVFEVMISGSPLRCVLLHEAGTVSKSASPYTQTYRQSVGG